MDRKKGGRHFLLYHFYGLNVNHKKCQAKNREIFTERFKRRERENERYGKRTRKMCVRCTVYTQIKRYTESQSTNGKINEAMIKWDSNVIANTRTRTRTHANENTLITNAILR